MFRPSAVRDTRQRRAVKISRGSLVLVDSPRKKTKPTSSDSVVAQLCKIYLIFSVWQLQEGRTGLHVTREGEEWKYSAAFLGVLLAVQPESVCGEREEEGGFLRGPRIHQMLHQQ